jgi:hypothetical protein
MAYGPTRSAYGAGNPGQRVAQFTFQDAQRIANVVHEVETARRLHNPSMLPRAVGTGGGLDKIRVRCVKSTLDAEMATWPSGVTLELGSAVPLSSNSSTQYTSLWPDVSQLSQQYGTTGAITASFSITTAPNYGSFASPPLEYIPSLTQSAASRWVELRPGFDSMSDVFGVISDITSDDSHYFITLIVGGTFQCRVISYAPGTRVLGPPPYVGSAELKALWQPLPLMSTAGQGRIIATGSYVQLGASSYPRVYDAIVRF